MIICEFKDKTPGSTGLSHEGLYEFCGEVEMKDTQLGWVRAVKYKSIETGEEYVRKLDDFNKKFQKTEILSIEELIELAEMFVEILYFPSELFTYRIKRLNGEIIKKGILNKDYKVSLIHGCLEATKLWNTIKSV